MFNFYLAYFSAFMLLVPLLIGLVRINFLCNNYFLIFILVLISMITELISFMIVKYLNISNILLYNTHTLFEISLISAFYYKFLDKKKIKSIILIICSLFVIFLIFELAVQSKNIMNEVPLTFESTYIIILTFLTFHQVLQKQVYKNIIDDPIFWFNSAFLIYFSGNLFIHLFSNFLHEFAQKAFYEIWGVHSVLNIILYTLISIGFWKTKPSQI